MKDLDTINSYYERLLNEFSHLNEENSPCYGIENVSIIVNKKRWKKRKKHKVFEHAQQPTVAFRLSRFSKYKNQGSTTKPSSMPDLNKCTRPVPPRNRSGHGKDTKQSKYKQSPFQSKFIANVVSEHRFDKYFMNLLVFNYPSQTKLKIYRCQLGAVKDSCCCSCNSDAMFEVMKGLYDCYKAQNCDNCECVLCCHELQEERKLGELRKSMASARDKVLDGKTAAEKENILNEMAKARLPLPAGKTASEKALIDKVRKELGLPASPKTATEKAKMRKAEAAGIITPLEGKTPAQKEEILRAQANLGLSLPEGRTASEKALIDKVKAKKGPHSVGKSEFKKKGSILGARMREAKVDGLMTPLKDKTPADRETILRALANRGIPLPEGQSSSEKIIIGKVRIDLGLPMEPKSKSIRDKHEQAAKAGLLQPLEGKTPTEKEKILQGQHNMGIPLPLGRTPSEKALIARIIASPRPPSLKTMDLLTSITGKSPEQKEKILRGRAMEGLPLPEGKSASEKKLINKVRADLGLPKEPKTKSIRDKYEQAAKAGLLQPLEGKTPAEKEKILQGQHNMGLPLPIGRTPSEKALIARIMASPRPPSLKTVDLLKSITGKPPEQQEKILRGRAMEGLPLPEGKSASEKKLLNKVRADLGLPKEPKTKSIRDKHEQAAKAGLLQPLEGKTPAEKEKVLKGLHDLGVPLPEGRTPSEKALIAKVAAVSRHPSRVAPPFQAPSEHMRRAKAEGLLTPLKGKTPEQKEKILKGLANGGIPLPEGQTPSEKKLIDQVRADLGLPIEPKTKSIRDKHEQAAKAGLLQPLEGKTPAEKEKVIKGLHDLGVPLPEGRTPSEKALIAKVAASSRHPSKVAPPFQAPSEHMRRAKAEGLLTPLKGKTPEQKEKILKGLANGGIPLPEGQSPSEKKLIDQVRADLGLPIEPKTKSIRDKHEQAAKAGLLQPLKGKTPAEKEKILQGLQGLGIPLPEGRTPSEKALIAKVKAGPRALAAVLAPSEQMRKAKAEGLLTPLKGKPPEQKEKILKALANRGIPLPEGQSPSEKKLVDKVRADLGLPIEPKTKSIRDKHEQAAKAGLLQPLEGKTPAEKEKVLKGLHDLGIPLPEGRTPSDKALIAKVAAGSRHPSRVAPPFLAPSEQMRRARAEGLLTPLKDKTPEQKVKILKALANRGIPLPEGQSPSEKNVIDKVRADLGLPPEPKTKSIRDKHEQAAKAGLLQPLQGKTPAEKEKVLKGLHDLGIPLPEGRTSSEKALVTKIAAGSRHPSRVTPPFLAPSEQMRRAKAEGLLSPLKGKTPEQKEKTLRALANRGIPLPEGQTPSEKKLVDKVRADLGLPKEPKTKSIRDKHEQAAKAGLLQPLEGKTPAEKEKVLKGLHDLGIPLPEGRTPSEKALVAKVKAGPRALAAVLAPSEQMRRAKTEGLLTPLKGKTPEQKEKILRALANRGIPLPEGQSASEKKLVDKVRADLGLPKEPKTKSIRDKHEQAAKAGLLQPLEGKTPAEKEKVLKGLHDLGIPLPEGRTPSEKALVAKVKAGPRALAAVLAPSEQMRRAKAEGLLTPLKGKTPEQKEKILKALAIRGIPLPEGQSPSEKKLVDKVRADLGLPPEPKTKSIRDKHEHAAKAGLLQPLEGKTPAEIEKVLKGLHDLGIPLPEGRTPSEKALVTKIAAGSRHLSRVTPPVLVPSEQMRRAKTEGLLTPLKGKTPEQKEKILKGLANRGIPLPEGQSPSEKKLIDQVRSDLGLPIEPKTKSIRDKHEQAAKAGLLQPLKGKKPAEKEKILQGLHGLGIPLPEGRTPSEKALVAKVKAGPRALAAVLAPSEQMRRAKAEGLLTPLKGKTPEQKEKNLKALAIRGIPLPEGQTPSEKIIVDKVRADLGLPKEPKSKSIRYKHEQAAKAGLLQPLEGKTPAEKEKVLKGLHDLGIPLPEGRTPSEKALIAKVAASSRHPSRVAPPFQAPSEQMRRAKAEGLLTPLKGKTPEQKEKILKALANTGIPLPEGKSPSEKKLIDQVRADLGLPTEPKTKSIRDKHEQAAKAGLLQPLAGKSPAEKEKVLKGLHDLGVPLPEGRTPSEKALIAKVAAVSRHPSRVAPPFLAPSEQMRRAKAEGLLTPLKGKTPEQKEKILKALANRGIPLPEGQSPSEKKFIEQVRADLGLPMEPKTKSIRDKHEQAAKAGLLQPLAGKTTAEKEKVLKGLHDLEVPLPEGRTPSEKALIAKVAAGSRHPSRVAPPFLALSEQMRRAKAEGLLTPLKGKTPEQKEKILKALANGGIPLPEGQSPSEKKLIDQVRANLGLPTEPKTKSIRDKHEQAAKAGLLQPLEGKTPAEKEKVLKGLHDLGIPLPEGRTPSEKALVAKVEAGSRHPSRVASPFLAPSEQMRRAKAEGLLTPLKGKTPEQKEKILKALANRGIPLPEGQSPSEKKLVDKVRANLGLPMEPKTKSIRDKHEQAAKAGLLQPLEGKTAAEKEKVLKGLHDLGIPLPEGRTPSEKALVAKVAAGSRHPSSVAPPFLAPSEQMRRAKAEGLLTPLKGKTPEQKEKILKALANRGIPLPEGQSPSEKKLIEQVRANLGLPTEPKTKSIRDKHEQAAKAGLLQPLEGKTPAEKEKVIKGLHDLGIPLPEGRTPSEKALVAKVAAGSRHPSRVAPPFLAPSEQMRRAKAEGLLTPLKGKTPEQKEKILKALANGGIPLPEGQSPSEKKLVDKVRADLGLPTEPKTKSIRDKHEQAAKAGLLQPLEGKTPAEKEKVLKGLHDLGIPLPEGRTPSEKALVAKIVASSRHPSEVVPPVLAPSDQMRRAKAEGLLTPLKGKTPEQKEKILKGLAMTGLPLPEGQSPSEIKLIDKVRANLGLPPEPKTKSIRDKHAQAAKAGLLQPLEGKTPAEKEKVLKGLHDLGIPVPEGRTPSEKALIAKVKASPRAPPIKAESLPTFTSDKIQKAKAAGLLTPLAGKTPEQKEKVLQGLAEIGLPLPEGKTPSQKALINKFKKDFGIPDRTASEKFRKTIAAGLLTPLEGKSPDQKEKILRGRAAAGLPLPMFKTPSEKVLIQKIKDDTGYVTPSPSERLRRAKAAGLVTPLKGKTPSMKEKILRGMKAAGVPIPEGETPSEKKLISKLISRLPSVIQSEKLRAAKAAGLLTPLEGKTPAQKQKIVEGLAMAGLPLPGGKTKSEKSMIAKVKARTPPEGKTPSEKSIIGKAKAAGLFTPITGKAPAEKERILKGLAEAGLPLPVGKTASEKDLVEKIRAEAGLPIEPTPSEKKGKIRKKVKKVGVSASKRAVGIDAEEFQDIIKTTTCDRGCGCDKKKIKFKHSYIKIRVTSPDISSLCDCPNECIPGVKSGAFIDNEGIKVTVGSAVGVTSYSMECINQLMLDKIVSNTDLNKTLTNYHNNLDDFKKPKFKVSSELSLNNSNKMNYILNASSSGMSTRLDRIQSDNIHSPSSVVQYQGQASKYSRNVESLRGVQSSDDVYKGPTSKPNSASSYETIVIIKNDMSLSTSTSNSMNSISLISVIDSSISSSSAYYSGYQSTNDLLSISSLDGPTTSDDAIDHPAIVGEHNVITKIRPSVSQQYTILRMSQLEANFGNKKMRKSKENSDTADPIVLFKQLPSILDVSKIMFKIMSKKLFVGASSIFIVVPMSDDEDKQGSSNCVDSITSNPSSECRFKASTTSPSDPDLALRTSSLTKRDEQVCGKGKKFYIQEISCSNDTETVFQNESLQVLRRIATTKDEFRQISRPNEKAQNMLEKAIPGVKTDTTADRACSIYKDHYAANVISRKITPVFLKGNIFSWFRLPGICKSSAESSACDIPPCFDPSFNHARRCRSHHHGRIKITKSPSLCPCFPPDDFKEERNRSAKVQKPSITSILHESDAALKKDGLHKAASSVPVSDTPPYSDCSSSPVPSNHRANVSRRDDYEETRNPSAKPVVTKKTGKCFSWLRQSSACETPPCFDPSFKPKPPNRPRHHGSSQQSQITKSPSLDGYPPDDFKEERKRSAKVQKPSISSLRHEGDTALKKAGLHKAASSVPVSDTPPYSDCSSSPVPSNHRRQRGCSQQHQTPESPWPNVSRRDDYEETRNPSAKPVVTKKTGKCFSWLRQSSACETPPCFDPSFKPKPPNRPRHHGSSQQSQITKSPSLDGYPPDDFKEERKRSAKVQKPSISSLRHEGDTALKKAGSNWLRLPSLRKVPQCFDPSQQYAEPPFCVCSPDDDEKAGSNWLRLPSLRKVPQCFDPSQQYAEPPFCVCSPDDDEKAGSDWLRLPSLRKVPQHLDPSQQYAEPPLCVCLPDDDEKAGLRLPCSDPSSSPVPPNHPRDHGCCQQTQTSLLCDYCDRPPDDLNVTRKPLVKVANLSVESMILKDRTAPKKTGLRLPCSDPSSSPVPPNHPRDHGCCQQTQTSHLCDCCDCPPEDMNVTRKPSVKVANLSVESMILKDRTAPKKTGKSYSWSRFVKRVASVACSTGPCSSCPRQQSQQIQTMTSLPDVKKSSSSESMSGAAKTYGVTFSRFCSTCKNKSCETLPSFDPCFSPMPSNRPHQHGCNQQNQTLALPPLRVSPTETNVQRFSCIELLLAAAKKAGVTLSWSRSAFKHKPCETLPSFDPSFSPLVYNSPRQHGCNQQNQTPALPPFCPPDAKAQGFSCIQLLLAAAKRAGLSCTCSRLASKNRACNTPSCFDSSLNPSNHPCRNRSSFQNQTSASLLSTFSPELNKITRNSSDSSFFRLPCLQKACAASCDISQCDRSSSPMPPHLGDLDARNSLAKVEKPPIESIRHEGRTATIKADVGSSWFRLPCTSQAPAKDPKIPKDLESPKTCKQKEETILSEEKLKVRPAKKDKCVGLLDLKPQTLASPKPDLVWQSTLFTSPNDSISKTNETLNSHLGQQATSKPTDPSSPKDFKSPKMHTNTPSICLLEEEAKTACERREDKPSSLNTGCKEKEGTECKKTIRCTTLPPAILELPPVKTSEGHLCEGIGPSSKWLDPGEIKRLRSELTLSTSGFKACKMNKTLKKSEVNALPEENIELNFGEAIRYFATMNPKCFRKLMQEVLQNQRDAEENKVEEVKKLKKIKEWARKKAANKGILNKTTTANEDNMPFSYGRTQYSDEAKRMYPQLGVKFRIAKHPTGTARWR